MDAPDPETEWPCPKLGEKDRKTETGHPVISGPEVGLPMFVSGIAQPSGFDDEAAVANRGDAAVPDAVM